MHPSIPRHGARIRPRAFWRQVGRREDERLEFKRSAHNIREPIAAMAMSKGGLLVLGVSDDRRLVGRPLDQETYDRITAVAYETGVEVELRGVVVGRVELTLVIVPAIRDRIVTTPDGRLLRRYGSANLPLRGDAVTRFVLERAGAGAWERSPTQHA